MVHSTTSSPASAVPFRDVARALWSLVTPLGIEAALPVEKSVRYRADRRRGVSPLCDVYVPEARTGSSVVLVHGGGFVLGSRRMKPVRILATRLVERGVAVCAVDYRMLFRGGRLAEAVGDVHDATQFWRDGCTSRGLDPARISLVGFSAGGTLAMLAAAERSDLHRLVGIYGLYELDTLAGVSARLLPRLLTGSRNPAVWRERSPISSAPPRIPTLLVHGDIDTLTPIGQAQRLVAWRDRCGLSTELRLFPGEPHAFLNYGTQAARDAADCIVEFVR